MRKYAIGVVLFTIILLFSGGYIARNRYQRNVLESNRRLLFCETLQPGMSVSQVSDILNRTGSVIIRNDDESVKFSQVSILFTDKAQQDLYGGWLELNFVEGKYNGAYELGFDYANEICRFGLTPK